MSLKLKVWPFWISKILKSQNDTFLDKYHIYILWCSQAHGNGDGVGELWLMNLHVLTLKKLLVLNNSQVAAYAYS